jgi:hypothetical protein
MISNLTLITRKIKENPIITTKIRTRETECDKSHLNKDFKDIFLRNAPWVPDLILTRLTNKT